MLLRNYLKKSDSAFLHLVRTLLSSNLAFLIDIGLLAFLTEVLQIYYLISAGVGFIVGSTVSYTLSVLWIFRRRTFRNKFLEYSLFVLIGLVGLVFSEFLIWFFTERIHLFYLISKIFAGSIVFFFNFLSRKFILFK